METPSRNVLTVSQLNRAASQLLNEHFFSVLVEGELSNVSMPASGHWYFSLKDSNAQIRCAMFKNQQRRQILKPENGKHVIVKAQVSLYEPRGDYQLIVDSMEAAGDGVLRRAFDALKQKLADEGLFAASHKKPLPALPACIGVITSPTGAAIRDIITVLKRRFPAIPVVIYPVAVQGEQAKYEIAKALASANNNPRCDVLILGRGGGSLEDLWAFNEEVVARAIFASDIPVIAAIGHETDVTIADFVADVRAATPSAAAEYAVPDQASWRNRFVDLESRLSKLMRQQLTQQQQSLGWLDKRLQQQHPKQRLMRFAQTLDDLDTRLLQAIQIKLQQRHSQLAHKSAQLWQHNPAIRLTIYQQRQQHLSQRLAAAMNRCMDKHQQRLANASQTLHAVSPLATLSRGYALATIDGSAEIVRSATHVKVGDVLCVQLGQGRVTSSVSVVETDVFLNSQLTN